MNSSIKLGLIGGGYWGKNLINEFNNCGVLHTICDINEEALQKYNEKFPHIKTTREWDDVLKNQEINAVCIALPAEMHYSFAKRSLQAGKDVYVEKPITLNIEEAEELINIAKECDRILMVGHLLHYHPCVEKMKIMIKEGKIGTIQTIVANRLSLGIFRQHENVLWSFAPHDISVILNLCGNEMPTKVICNGNTGNITNGIADITNSVLHFKDIYANINVNWLSPYKEQKMTIIGDKGILVFDDVEKEEKLSYYSEYLEYENMNALPKPVKNREVIHVDMSKSPLLRECHHFVECCLERKQPITDGKEGLRVLKVLNSLQKSLEEKSGINLKLEQDKNNDNILKTEKEEREYFVHETAIVDDGATIGKGTKIWHYSHICKGAIIGDNCNIGQNVFIADGAKIGNNCKVQNNVSIYAGVEAEDYVFFGPSCVLTNDINPRGMHSKGGEYIKTKLETGVTLGANSTIVCGNTIGEHALIGSGAVICKDVEAYSIMVGNPGKKIGEIDEKGERKIYNK